MVVVGPAGLVAVSPNAVGRQQSTLDDVEDKTPQPPAATDCAGNQPQPASTVRLYSSTYDVNG